MIVYGGLGPLWYDNDGKDDSLRSSGTIMIMMVRMIVYEGHYAMIMMVRMVMMRVYGGLRPLW
jgi:hypothetical protein